MKMHLDNGPVIVPVYLYDHWRWLILHTSLDLTSLHYTFTNQLVLAPPSKKPLQPSEARTLYSGPWIYAGPVPTHPTHVRIIDVTTLEQFTSTTVDGELGLNVLTNYVVNLDFEKGTASFSTNRPATIGFFSTFYRDTNGQFTFPAVIPDGKNLKMTVDSGALTELSLNDADWAQAFPSGNEKAIRVKVAHADGKFRETLQARLPRLRIGNFVYTNLLCRRLDSKSKPSSVGVGFLKRHRVTLDYLHRLIDFDPLPNQEPAEADMSGIHFKWIRYSPIVAAVDPESPADDSGLMFGDRILKINDQPLFHMKPIEMDALLRSGDGKTLEIEALRGPHEFKVKLVLKI
jgi:hypothetical protein